MEVEKDTKEKTLPIQFSGNKMVINNSSELLRVAETISLSGLIPDSLRGKKADVLVILMQGLELGLSPLVAINNIHVIKGKPTLSVSAMEAIVRASGQLISLERYFVGKEYEDDFKCVCKAVRKGGDSVEDKFSVGDAIKIGKWGTNTWAQYPNRMLMKRAVGFVLRDLFPDLLGGIYSKEEMEDTVDMKDVSQSKTAHIDDVDLGILPGRSENVNSQAEEGEASQGVNMPTETEEAGSLI